MASVARINEGIPNIIVRVFEDNPEFPPEGVADCDAEGNGNGIVVASLLLNGIDSVELGSSLLFSISMEVFGGASTDVRLAEVVLVDREVVEIWDGLIDTKLSRENSIVKVAVKSEAVITWSVMNKIDVSESQY